MQKVVASGNKRKAATLQVSHTVQHRAGTLAPHNTPQQFADNAKATAARGTPAVAGVWMCRTPSRVSRNCCAPVAARITPCVNLKPSPTLALPPTPNPANSAPHHHTRLNNPNTTHYIRVVAVLRTTSACSKLAVTAWQRPPLHGSTQAGSGIHTHTQLAAVVLFTHTREVFYCCVGA